MRRSSKADISSLEGARAALAGRLRQRREEIEQVVLARIYAIADPTESSEPQYLEGLRSALDAALDYGLTAIERGEERAPPPPTALFAQARMAARNGVPVETVLRRYFAGYGVLSEFLLEEARPEGLLGETDLRALARGQAALFDRMVARVTEEHTHESEERLGSAEERRRERIERLLAGELLPTADLVYDLDANHLALTATGAGADEAINDLAGVLGCRLLRVKPAESTVWAWIGSRHPVNRDELEQRVLGCWPSEAHLAIGDPARGLEGWRLSHRQAKAALTIALRGPSNVVRYRDVALLAGIVQDDLLVKSLRQIYLAPLERERDGGEALRKTAQAYFVAERNVSSTAAALRLNRHTVTNRLRTIEQHLGRPLSTCAAELEVALRLEEVTTTAVPEPYC